MADPALSPADPKSSNQYPNSPAVKKTVETAFTIAPHMTWDSYVRLFYDRANRAIQDQANLLLRRGHIEASEVHYLVEHQRNRLVTEFRNPLSPFGRLYSEILKPGDRLPTLESLLARKGSLEAVLRSVGRSRQVVNRVAVVSRIAGPAVIVLQLPLTAVVIYTAAPQDRGRLAARETGGMVVGVAGGIGGAWAGCATLASLASPSLVIPIVGEIGTGGACFVGGLVGGLGLGWLANEAGRAAGVALYDFVASLHWLSR